jgi:CheY-like chemotaxis protein
MKILLVDDDAFLRDMYATKFGEHGHTVVVASTGEQALNCLEKDQYDVVLMDMIMPGMTGVELLRKIEDLKLEKKPVSIVLSNQGEHQDIEAAKQAGAIGYIVKAEMIPSEVVERVTKLVS